MWLMWAMMLLGCGSDSTVSSVTIGLPCWDTNGNDIQDASEDINEDGIWDALDCQGTAGENGLNGIDGAPGEAGEDGAQGPAGAAGLSCWDTNGDGIQDADEDINGDGIWDALDCQPTASSLEKGALYEVTGSTASTSTAACADNDDIMLTGGCRFQESCIPAHFTGYPRYNDDDSQPADYYCSLNCGSVTASGFCLVVD